MQNVASWLGTVRRFGQRAGPYLMVEMLLPGGTSFMVLDHLTGYMYAYPRWVRLQVGTDMLFDRRDDNGRSATPGLVTRQFDDYVRYAFGGPPVRAD